jgi:hypothetical protein
MESDMKRIAVFAVVLIVLAGTVPVSAAPPMYSVKTTVTAIVPYTHGNGIRGCTIRVAQGMNGNTLTTFDELCALRRGARITLNYFVGSTTRCDWRGRNCKGVQSYTFSNAYAGW